MLPLTAGWSVEFVVPVTYALPEAYRPIPSPISVCPPPRYVQSSNCAPVLVPGFSLATKASGSVTLVAQVVVDVLAGSPRQDWKAFLIGKSVCGFWPV